MRLNPARLLIATLLSCSLIAGSHAALAADENQLIRIAAEKATLDQKQGITTYTGDVQFTQGSMSIKADVVIAHFNPVTQKLDRIHAKGSPARYELQATSEKGLMLIEATEVNATFEADSQRIRTINAKGSPAIYQQQPTPDKGVISARALSITYTPFNQNLALDEQASLEQDGASMSGSHITYDLTKEVMQAAGGDSSSETEPKRIEIIIPPQTIRQD